MIEDIDRDLLYQIAKLYHIEGHTQPQISKIIHFSTPQICRLLCKAKEMGIVKIDVSFPSADFRREVENQLEHKLSLGKVIISESSSHLSTNDQALYRTAADYLNDILPDAHNFGIGIGKTLYHTLVFLQNNRQVQKLHTTPLVGVYENSHVFLDNNHIAEQFCKSLSAPSPLLIDLPRKPRHTLSWLEHERLLRLKEAWGSLDTAVIGLGGCAERSLEYQTDLSILAKENNVQTSPKGDIVGRLLLEDFHQNSDREIAVPLQLLQYIRNVVAIAHGSNKIETIAFAAKHKYISTLVTDEFTAIELLER